MVWKVVGTTLRNCSVLNGQHDRQSARTTSLYTQPSRRLLPIRIRLHDRFHRHTPNRRTASTWSSLSCRMLRSNMQFALRNYRRCFFGGVAFFTAADDLHPALVQPVHEHPKDRPGYSANLVPNNYPRNVLLTQPVECPVILTTPSEAAVVGLDFDPRTRISLARRCVGVSTRASRPEELS